MAVHAKSHEVPGTQWRIRCEGFLLRNIADQLTAPLHRAAAQCCGPGMEVLQAQQDFQERGFAAAVRAEDRKELAGVDVEVQVLPQCPFPELQGGSAEAHYRFQRS
ncbi:hypothetical protein D9M72_364490 [compost metagenome]